MVACRTLTDDLLARRESTRGMTPTLASSPRINHWDHILKRSVGQLDRRGRRGEP